MVNDILPFIDSFVNSESPVRFFHLFRVQLGQLIEDNIKPTI